MHTYLKILIDRNYDILIIENCSCFELVVGLTQLGPIHFIANIPKTQPVKYM